MALDSHRVRVPLPFVVSDFATVFSLSLGGEKMAPSVLVTGGAIHLNPRALSDASRLLQALWGFKSIYA